MTFRAVVWLSFQYVRLRWTSVRQADQQTFLTNNNMTISDGILPKTVCVN